MAQALMAGNTASTASLSLHTSSVTKFNGLSAAHSFRPLVLSPACAIALREALMIEASRQPTRRKTVKTRHRHVRKKLSGTTKRPQLAVFWSNQHLYAQVINDTKQHSLAASSTLSKEICKAIKDTASPTIDAAKKVGEAIRSWAWRKVSARWLLTGEALFTMNVSRYWQMWHVKLV